MDAQAYFDECTTLFGEGPPISSERTTLSRGCTVRTEEFWRQANCTPPPEYLPDSRPISPEQEECEESTTASPWYLPPPPRIR